MNDSETDLPLSRGPSVLRDEFYRTLQKEYAQRYSTFDPLSIQILYNLSQTYVRAEARLSARLSEHGITFPGLNILIILRRYGMEGCPLNTLSELLLVSRANITGVVDNVVRKGFVIREDHATDRRVILAKITPKGEKWMDSYLPGHYLRIREMLSGLNAKEKTALVELLSKLRQTSCQHPRETKKNKKGS